MSNHTDDSEKARTRIEKQAIGLIDQDSDVISLLEALDLDSARRRHDGYEESHKSAPFDAMLRAYFLKDLLGYNDTELHRRLTTNPSDATAIGFENVPARTTFVRTWKNRFDENLREYVRITSKGILEYAHERGNPLGLRSLEAEDKGDVSHRTEVRHIREKSIEVAEEMRSLLYNSVDLGRPKRGTRYDTSAFLGLQSLISSEQCAAEQGSEIYADSAPTGLETPDADTHLYYLKRLSVTEVTNLIQQAISVQVKTARRHLEFNRPVEIAIDMTYVAYYGRRDESVNYGPNDGKVVVMGAPPTKGFDWCYKFATASIVGENVRFMLAIRPHIKGERMGTLVRELYWQAAEHVNISTVYADSEFFAADVVQGLQETGSNYLIRVPENERVERKIRRKKNDVWVEDRYGFYGPTVAGPSNDRVETTLVGIPKNRNPSETVVFSTNFNVDDEIDLDRRVTKRRINRYSRRWGIETNYRSLDDFLPYTTSKEYSVRLFHFSFAVLVFNMWRLVDFLVQVNLDDIEYRIKPRIKAKRFLNLAKSALRYG